MRRTAKLVAVLRTSSYRAAFLRHRVAAAVEHEAAFSELYFRTIIDVGANRGQFSLFAIRSFPRARIIAFEPLATPAERYRAVFAGDDRIRLFRAALGSESGQAVMHVAGHDDASSLLPITARQKALFRGTGEVRTETVRVGRLSDFIDALDIEPPAVLKLDVQGYELEVLRGCEDLLSRFAYIYAEASFVELYEGQTLADELIAWLRARGYALSGVYGSDLSREGVQADMLFRRVTGGS